MELQSEKEYLYEILDKACKFYQSVLTERAEGELAREYLNHRGYGRQTAKEFLLGAAPNEWSLLTDYLVGQGIDARWVHAAGLAKPRERGGFYDLFRNRLIIPIQDVEGRVVAFGARALADENPKYINSPETAVYNKSSILYNLHRAFESIEQRDETLIVEGYFDVIALVKAGVMNVVAASGTALTSEHASILSGICKKAISLFDQDAPGQKATRKSVQQLLKAGMSASIGSLPDGDDPDSYLSNNSSDAFRRRMQKAKPAIEQIMEQGFSTANSIEAIARATEDTLVIISLVQDEEERNNFVRSLAFKTGLGEEQLYQRIEQFVAEKEDDHEES